MSKQQAHRFGELDLLRAMACAAVVAFHFLSRGPKANWISGVSYPTLESVARYGYLGVHLFFMISGFVILLSAQSSTPREFFASRVSRLMPALWAGATLTAAVAWWFDHPVFSVSFPHYLVNLTMLPQWFGVPYVDGVYWSLAYELHFYIYVWIALRLRLLRHLEWLLAAWLMVSGVNALRPMWPVEFWLNAKWAPFFVAGATFYLIRMQGGNVQRVALVMASYALSLHYSMDEARGAGVSPEKVALIVSGMFLVFLSIATKTWNMQSSRIIVVAGALTYPVYLIHQYFGMMVYEKLRLSIGSPIVSLSVALVVVVAISWGIHAVVERPVARRIRTFLLPRRAIESKVGLA